MATDLKPKAAATKYDAFVDKQVGQFQARLRRLDILRSLLQFFATVLGYGLLMALLDLAWGQSAFFEVLRGVFFVAFLGAAGFFLWQTAGKFFGRVNPRYAARELEKTVPQAKNSVINYLDLKDEKLSPVIHGALGLKAARDLKKSQADKAADSTSNWFLLAVCGLLTIGFLVLLFLRSSQFSSLLERAYLPFLDIGLGTRNRITMIQPEAGNVALPPDTGIEIRAKINGPLPKGNQEGKPTLLFRYHKEEAFASMPLTEVPRQEGNWYVHLTPDRVLGGFYYKVSAGDAETDEFRITVRSEPRPLGVDIFYEYPGFPPRAEADKFTEKTLSTMKVQALRETRLTFLVQTNRRLKSAAVLFEDAAEKIRYEGAVLDDATTFRVHWPVAKSGQFRLQFTSRDGEDYTSPQAYPVIEDKNPRVTLDEPKTEVTLPPNGTLRLKGKAEDKESGIRRMALALKILEGEFKPELASKPFRSDKDFQLGDGSFREKMDYEDFLALDEIQTAAGESFPLHAGMKLEVWLQAWDGSDYPHGLGNRGESERRRIRIEGPTLDPAKIKKEREKALEDLKKFAKEQDSEFSKDDKGGPSKTGGNPKKSDTGGGKDPKTDRKDLTKVGAELAKKAEEKKKESNPGEGKGEGGPSSDSKSGEKSKGGSEPKSKEGKSEPEKTGASKEGGAGAEKEPPAKSKDRGDKKGPDKTEDKAGGAEEKGSAKSGGAEDGAGEKTGESKGAGGKTPEGSSGSAKEGPAEGMKDTGEAKPGEPGKGGPEPGAKGTPKGKEPGKEGPGATDIAETKGDGGPKATSKAGEKDAKAGKGPDAAAKAGEKGPDKSLTKSGKEGPKTEDSAGAARDDGSKTEADKAAGEKSVEDVERSKKDLKDPEKAEAAAHELSRIAEEGEDAKAREAAKEALEADGREVGKPGKVKGPETAAKGPEVPGAPKGMGPDDPSKMVPGAENKGGKPSAEDGFAKGAEVDPLAEKGKGKDVTKAGYYGEGAKNRVESLNTTKALEEYAKNGGDLLLRTFAETLKELVEKGLLPEELREDVKGFSEKIAKLREEEKRWAKKGPDLLTGGPSTLPGFSPTPLGPGSDSSFDPAAPGRLEAPPEFREAHEMFRRILGTKGPKS